MKIRLTLPGGARFEFERERMDEERFHALCKIAGGAVAVAGLAVVMYFGGVVALLIAAMSAAFAWALWAAVEC